MFNITEQEAHQLALEFAKARWNQDRAPGGEPQNISVLMEDAERYMQALKPYLK